MLHAGDITNFPGVPFGLGIGKIQVCKHSALCKFFYLDRIFANFLLFINNWKFPENLFYHTTWQNVAPTSNNCNAQAKGKFQALRY